MRTSSKTLEALSRRTDVLFAVFFVVMVSMMVLPLPPLLIDILIAFNLSFALVVLITTLYLKNVLEISTFPAVILIATVFRLALTISSTRLVLAEGHAGDIIHAFGSVVVAGNLVVGLVVFLIVALVQFIVVTKGAERIAEVGARFTLDAMPGKQLAIDSDLRNGHITAEAAQKRRQQLEKESQFFGAMDGALRFVKGDAIAGLVVVAVNLIGGLAIGIFQHGMSFSQSAHLYSLLSIGDGLVSQIPSMLMAVAAGAVVTRVADESSGSLGSDIGRQLSRHPRALGVAAFLLLGLGVVPGFPAAVLLPIGLLLAAAAGMTAYRRRQAELRPGWQPPANEDPAQQHQPLDRAKYGDPVMATLSPNAFLRLDAANLGAEIESRIRRAARIAGVAVTVPTFNIDERMGDNLIHVQVENVPAGLIRCEEGRSIDLIAEDMVRIVRRHVGAIFSVDDAAQWLTGLEPRLGKLAADVRAQVPPLTIVAVVRRLLDAGVTLSQPRSLLEVLLSDAGALEPDALAEKARDRLSHQIAYALLDRNGVLPTLALSPDWERFLADPDSKNRLNSRAQHLADQVRKALEEANQRGVDPVLVVASHVRIAAQSMLAGRNCIIPVLAVDEIEQDITCQIVATIGRGSERAA
ncbi:flagellar biosynthesis protein FlhA [Rhizobium paknamense]|uniref:Type III secretion protein V n=1 Tax=Rhizobium paknamense TaxID=1206817 RepID=A0ABU0IDS3_9HYPH|nr:flagellar biosynthesis protein FlhA [Rhizobium paknamense]MDQ0456393.1 type III secretion protein V [Rhizobium paknamense]